MQQVKQAASSSISIRLMTAADVAAGMRLCEIAGWNQQEGDWDRFLRLEPAGCFVACAGAEVCGTGTALHYGERFGWIGMILVHPDKRGHGIGTDILRHAMNYLDGAGVETQKLDATPMGYKLYLQLGFRDEYQVDRWQGTAAGPVHPRLKPMEAEDLRQVCRWDREMFGADRTELLTCLWQEGAAYSGLIYRGAEITGYMLGRAGSRAHYFGPWVATEQDSAEQLWAEFMSRFRGEPVFVDIPSPNPAARHLARSAGFTTQRPFTRMYRGPNRFPGIPEMVYAIGGPEVG